MSIAVVISRLARWRGLKTGPAGYGLGLEGEETDDQKSKPRPRTSDFVLLAAGIGLAVSTAFALVRRNRRQWEAADRA